MTTIRSLMQPIFCLCKTTAGFDFDDVSLASVVQCQHLVITEVTHDVLGRLAAAFKRCPGKAFLADSVSIVVCPDTKSEAVCNVDEVYKRIADTFGAEKYFSLVDRSSDRVLSTYFNSEGLLPHNLSEFLLKQCQVLPRACKQITFG